MDRGKLSVTPPEKATDAPVTTSPPFIPRRSLTATKRVAEVPVVALEKRSRQERQAEADKSFFAGIEDLLGPASTRFSIYASSAVGSAAAAPESSAAPLGSPFSPEAPETGFTPEAFEAWVFNLPEPDEPISCETRARLEEEYGELARYFQSPPSYPTGPVLHRGDTPPRLPTRTELLAQVKARSDAAFAAGGTLTVARMPPSPPPLTRRPPLTAVQKALGQVYTEERWRLFVAGLTTRAMYDDRRVREGVGVRVPTSHMEEAHAILTMASQGRYPVPPLEQLMKVRWILCCLLFCHPVLRILSLQRR